MPTITNRDGGQQETNRSSDTTSHPDGPAELIRSGYALRVGEIDALVVSDGTMSIPAQRWPSTPPPPTSGPGWTTCSYRRDSVAAEHGRGASRRPDRTHRRGARGGVPGIYRGGQLTRRLEAAGLGLESLTDVVLTHMHMDHIGGLLGLKGRLRPDLRIHVAAAEAEFWAGKADLSRATMPPGVPESLRSVAKRFLDQLPQPAAAVREGTRGGAGGARQSHRGHTPGHSVVRLESGGDRLMFGGDSMFPPGSTAPTGTTASTRSPRRQCASGSVSCGSSRRPASRWCPLTCRPGRRPGGGDPRRLSLGTGLLGALTACWVKAELNDNTAHSCSPF